MQTTENRRRFFRSFEAKSLRTRSLLTQLADDLTSICGSTPFLFSHIVIFTVWIGINTGFFAAIKPFDPYPFGLLTMVVSLEAIFLSIFVLVSQNRSAYINSLREEVHMRVNLIAEEEITKVLEVVADLRKHLGVKKEDPELDEMLKRIDTNYLETSILNQIEKARGSILPEIVKEFPNLAMETMVQRPFEAAKNMASNAMGEEKEKKGS